MLSIDVGPQDVAREAHQRFRTPPEKDFFDGIDADRTFLCRPIGAE
jgi:hypothetical protein